MTARDSEGAPIYGFVSDPAATSGPPPYRATFIASCPRCGSDLIDEGFSFWCSGCREAITANEVAYFDEGQPDD